MLSRLNKLSNPLVKYTRPFQTQIYPTQTIKLNETNETIVEGGSSRFPLLPNGFKNIKQICVIGWGSQAPAQACNLRDSLTGTDIKVCVGLRENSKSIGNAIKEGFNENDGTLGNMYDIASKSDMVIYLVSDYAQTQTYSKLFASMKPNSTLGLSHGFLLGYFDNNNIQFPEDINVVMVAPKGMGNTVRDKYLENSGINSSVAVHQDINGMATDHALSWAIGIGSPYIFNTTLEKEYISDIFGERGILLGALYGMSECLFKSMSDYLAPCKAYSTSVRNITGPISETISRKGLLDIYASFKTNNDLAVFEDIYSKTYFRSKELLQEIYDEVKSGNEINSVIMAGHRTKNSPMTSIDTTYVWSIEKQCRGKYIDEDDINPITSGIYVGIMMAQIDILMENGHNYSEIVNESIIEAIDSLNPYLHQKGISYMVDNCSTTARLGARKWGPRFDYMLSQSVITSDNLEYENTISHFLRHPIHNILEQANRFR